VRPFGDASTAFCSKFCSTRPARLARRPDSVTAPAVLGRELNATAGRDRPDLGQSQFGYFAARGVAKMRPVLLRRATPRPLVDHRAQAPRELGGGRELLALSALDPGSAWPATKSSRPGQRILERVDEMRRDRTQGRRLGGEDQFAVGPLQNPRSG